MPSLVDTHCHLDFHAFDDDRDEVLARAVEAGVRRIVIPAIDLASSREIVNLVRQPVKAIDLYAAVGVHPNDATTWNGHTLHALRDLARQAAGRVVAMGEIGLDYYRDRAPHDVQRQVFRQQLELAAELGLPVIIHNREASADVLEILEQWQQELARSRSPLADRPGVLHSFSAGEDVARRVTGLNFMIGITGPVTFKNAPALHQVVAGIPLSHLLVETDAPFLTPHPHRGQRNEPAYVRLVAEKIGSIINQPYPAVAEQTSANAGRLFKW